MEKQEWRNRSISDNENSFMQLRDAKFSRSNAEATKRGMEKFVAEKAAKATIPAGASPMDNSMSQYTNGGGDAVDQILCDMRQHVSGLQDKLTVAGAAVTKSQTVNEKIAIMSQYQDKVSTLNSCWRSKNRNNLVANLQHENRQMIALEEENRQLRFALKEMEDGLHLIMNDYRRVFSGFIRSDLLFDFAKIRNKVNFNSCIDFETFYEIIRRAEKSVVTADQKIADQEETITQLKYENDGLRELLHCNPNFKKRNSDSHCFASQRKNSVIMVKGVSLPAALEDSNPSDRGSKDPLQPPPSINHEQKTNKYVNFNMIRGQSMPGCSSDIADNTNGSSLSTGIRWPVHNTRPKRAAIIKKLVQEKVEVSEMLWRLSLLLQSKPLFQLNGHLGRTRLFQRNHRLGGHERGEGEDKGARPCGQHTSLSAEWSDQLSSNISPVGVVLCIVLFTKVAQIDVFSVNLAIMRLNGQSCKKGG
uniref:Uncharacterized protein n=2 Tax=Ditylenchus dipsaci TaxID=166011 RepID=A0A915DUV4_9BILA